MAGPKALRHTHRTAVFLIVLAGVGLSATSIARRPPEPSTTSRATDTPVVDHIPGGGPDGGTVSSLAVLGTRPVTLFAALENGGVFISSNAGLTWTPADRGLPADWSCDLVAARDASAVYAACGDGLFKTTNNGGLWRQLDIDNAVAPVIAPSVSSVLYEPPAWGVVLSRDGGRRWEHLHGSIPLGCYWAFAIDPLDPFTLFCSDEQWAQISRDAGATWRPLTRGPRPDANISSLAIDPSNAQTIVAGTSDGRTFRTTDRGAVWYRVADGPATGAIEALQFVDGSSGVLFGTQGSSIIRTLDAGDHWEVIPSAGADGLSQAFAVDPFSPSTIYAGTRRGVMVTTDLGKHWELRRRGITRSSVSVEIQDGTPSTIFAKAIDETFVSRDGGDTWARADLQIDPPATTAIRLPSNRTPSGIVTTARDPRIAYAATTDSSLGPIGPLAHEIWRTLDGGENWQLVDQPNERHGQCCTLLADPNDVDTVYAIINAVGLDGGNVVRRTSDGGLTWTDLPVQGLIYAMAVAPTVPTTLLIQAYDVTQRSRYAFLKSTDRGDHWIRAGAGLPDNVEITNIAAESRRPAHLFVGTHGRGVFRSVDAGISWLPAGH
jgi:photosystem II stability/assembly factor-like uncharacterized protein